MDNSDKPKNNLLNRYYPLVFPAGEEVPEWNTPGVDSLDRFLRSRTKSPESRDIVRALIRHLDDIGGTRTTASDDQIGDWTGIDAANVGRRVRQDRIFKTIIEVRRGKPRRAGEKALATEYVLIVLFECWKRFIAAEEQPPNDTLVNIGLQDWADKKKVLIGQFRGDVIKQAYTDVEAQMNRPLVKRDRRRVVARAIQLAQDRLAEQAARGGMPAALSEWKSPPPASYGPPGP